MRAIRGAWPAIASTLRTFGPAFLIVLVSVGLYLQILFYTGYISWGNFGTPIVLTFGHSFLPSEVTWSFYSSYGTPVTSPVLGLADGVYNPILLVLGGAANSEFAMKLFLVLSTVFFAFSFYRLASAFTSSRISKTTATLFMLLNPVTINLVQQGLFESYFWQGFFFLGLSFVPAALRNTGLGRIKYSFVSALCLVLTVGQPELFYLGLPLYFVLVFYFAVLHKSEYTFRSLVNFGKTAIAVAAFVVVLLLPLILTIAYSAYNLSPSSSLANPLSDYIAYSPNVWNLLAMDANPAFPLAHLISGPWSLVWITAIAVLTLVLLSSGLLFGDERLAFLAMIAILAALMGAGSVSPFASFNIFLYEHFPGYQVLNDGLYWAWIVIIPIYGLMLSVVADRLQELGLLRRNDQTTGEVQSRATISRLRAVRRGVRPVAMVLICSILLIVLLTPLLSQAYYGSNGIHDNDLPAGYSTLITQLSGLVGSTGYGVAYFPPDIGVVLGNSSGGSVDPLLLDPWVRAAMPITYGTVATPSGYYFNWVYQEFYSNETRDIAQLMGVMGVKFFVTLNNVSGQGDLYTKEMSLQHNITLIYDCPSYSIFESTLAVNVASNTYGITVLSDSYDSIQAAAVDGLDVSKVPLTFADDLDAQNFGFFLNHTAALFLRDPADLTSLAVARYVNASDSFDTLGAVSNYAYSIMDGWVRSTALYVWPQTIPNAALESAPIPFIVTESGTPLSETIHLPSPGNYTLWMDWFDSPVPSSQLTVSIGDASLPISTSAVAPPGGFSWTGIPFNAIEPQTALSVEGSGLNGIAQIVVLRTGLVGAELSTLNSSIEEHRLIAVYYGDNSNTSAFHDSIRAINNAASANDPLNISTGPDSYRLSGPIRNVSLVRLNYFSGMVPSSSSATVIPVLGGMSFLVVTSNTSGSLVFQSVEYVPLLCGTAVLGFGLLFGALMWWWDAHPIRRRQAGHSLETRPEIVNPTRPEADSEEWRE